MRERALPWSAIGAALAALLAVGVVVVVVLGGSPRAPDRPVPVVWNRESCAHCRMAIGDPSYAAQLVTTDGAVANFDDVGCLLRYLDEHHPRVHRLWFHHPSADRWLGADEVGFAQGAMTPMGWGLTAAERRPGLLDLAGARAVVATRDGGPAQPGAMP
ncbi:MAG: hypothetical protein JNK64_40955 [Myxococcales bacterium]|nr:hypothetical protein [Myxococcales bacterium]